MTKENKVKLGIILIVGFIFLGIFSLYSLHKSNNENLEIDINEEPFEMERVTEYSNFFVVVNNINQYLYQVQEQNNIAVYNMLSKNFILNQGVTLDNVLWKVKNYNGTVSFKAKEMYFKDYNTKIYYVIGDIIENEYETTVKQQENVKFLVAIDYNNITVAIYPLNEEDN